MKNGKGKSLKSLSRLQILELLVKTMEENEALKAENEKLKKENGERRLICQKAGSLAEASLALTRIFEEADKAVEIYKSSLVQSEEQTAATLPEAPDNGPEGKIEEQEKEPVRMTE